MAVTLLVTGHARWYGTVLAGYATQARTSGRTPEQITAREAALFDALISADGYPALRAAVDDGVFASDADPFVFGIERILDGVAAYLDALAAGGKRTAPAAWAVLEDADVASGTRGSARRRRLCGMRIRHFATLGSSSGPRCETRASAMRGIRRA